MDDGRRQQILEAAAHILQTRGVRAVSTRSVATAADVRPASLYQLFGDMDGLLVALARHVFEMYLAEKRTLGSTDDPVADLCRGWDLHVDFGLRHPAFYVLMFGSDRPGRRPPAVEQGRDLLLRYLDRVAAAGRLRVPPVVAAELALAGSIGVTLALIGAAGADASGSLPLSDDLGLSARMRDALFGAMLTDRPAAAEAGLVPSALALDAALGAHATDALRPTEAALLRDWLHKLAR